MNENEFLLLGGLLFVAMCALAMVCRDALYKDVDTPSDDPSA
ncbi:hypothetical protein J2W30_004484 [Variovorax boronicumulans]|nr:hypothetical protein [Variovorax boronicumulans]MDQ0036709.1 hypothetical protein [Variovorax boronicumulans]